MIVEFDTDTEDRLASVDCWKICHPAGRTAGEPTQVTTSWKMYHDHGILNEHSFLHDSPCYAAVLFYRSVTVPPL